MPSVMFTSSCKLMPSAFQEGSVYTAPSLKELEMCTVKVSSLCIYETPLQSWKSGGSPVHKFLVVEMSAIVHPTQGAWIGSRKIRAEKTTGQSVAGIHVEEMIFMKEEEHSKTFSIESLDVSIPMDQLLQILQMHCADYDILFDNCQWYAFVTVTALRERFLGLQPELRDVLNNLPPRPIMPGEVILRLSRSCVSGSVVSEIIMDIIVERVLEKLMGTHLAKSCTVSQTVGTPVGTIVVTIVESLLDKLGLPLSASDPVSKAARKSMQAIAERILEIVLEKLMGKPLSESFIQSQTVGTTVTTILEKVSFSEAHTVGTIVDILAGSLSVNRGGNLGDQVGPSHSPTLTCKPTPKWWLSFRK